MSKTNGAENAKTEEETEVTADSEVEESDEGKVKKEAEEPEDDKLEKKQNELEEGHDKLEKEQLKYIEDGRIKNNEEEEDPDDLDDSEEVDHPMDQLIALIKEIESQERRTRNKKIFNLQAELRNNVYPLFKAFVAIMIDYMQMMDESEQEETRDAIVEGIKNTREVCEIIVKYLNDDTDDDKDEITDDELSKVLTWAKDYLKQTENVSSEDLPPEETSLEE